MTSSVVFQYIDPWLKVLAFARNVAYVVGGVYLGR
jgi:hypothetical protein